MLNPFLYVLDAVGVSCCIEAGSGGSTGANVNGKLHYLSAIYR